MLPYIRQRSLDVVMAAIVVVVQRTELVDDDVSLGRKLGVRARPGSTGSIKSGRVSVVVVAPASMNPSAGSGSGPGRAAQPLMDEAT